MMTAAAAPPPLRDNESADAGAAADDEGVDPNTFSISSVSWADMEFT